MKSYLPTKNIYLSKSKSNHYIKNKVREKFKDLENSKRILLKKINYKKNKILDVGCATGGMFSALKNKFGSINYTGIDIDSRCINNAKTRFSGAKFYKMDLFDKKLKNNFYDIVMMWNWTYMYPDWKKLFYQAIKLSKKFIMFDNRLRLNGPTITDIDLSYQYYHKSNKRNFYINHNLYELISFFQIGELNIKTINIYGYHLPGETSARLPLPISEVLIGGVLLEKYPNNFKIKRYGVTPESTKQSWTKINIQVPGYKKLLTKYQKI